MNTAYKIEHGIKYNLFFYNIACGLYDMCITTVVRDI